MKMSTVLSAGTLLYSGLLSVTLDAITVLIASFTSTCKIDGYFCELIPWNFVVLVLATSSHSEMCGLSAVQLAVRHVSCAARQPYRSNRAVCASYQRITVGSDWCVIPANHCWVWLVRYTSASLLGLTGALYQRSTVGLTGAWYPRSTVGLTGASYKRSTVGLTGASYQRSTVGLTGASYQRSTVGLTHVRIVNTLLLSTHQFYSPLRVGAISPPPLVSSTVYWLAWTPCLRQWHFRRHLLIEMVLTEINLLNEFMHTYLM